MMNKSIENLLNILNIIKCEGDKINYNQFINLLEEYNNDKINFINFLANISQIFDSKQKEIINTIFPPFFNLDKFNALHNFVLDTSKIYKSSIFKHGTVKDFILFDQIKKLLKNEDVYVNFLRCIQLFIDYYITADELYEAANSFIGKSPLLLSEFKQLLHQHLNIQPHLKRQKSNNNYEIDFSSCRKMGASYRALPSSYCKQLCSGRTQLCNEVLNDTWVSFPSWSEDIPSTASKISAYQEFAYRCEDERYELDIVIENVKSAIEIYEKISKKMIKMSPVEMSQFSLDDQLGGTSLVLQRKVIERIYGDRSTDIIVGLKHKPAVAIPIAMRRLKCKLADFENHRAQFNGIWREQMDRQTQRAALLERNMARQNDLKEVRSKVILNVAEVAQAESDELSIIYGPHHSMRGQKLEYANVSFAFDASEMLKFDARCLAAAEKSNSLVSLIDDMLHILHQLINFANEQVDNKSDKKCITIYLNGYWFIVFNLHNKLTKTLDEMKQELVNVKDSTVQEKETDSFKKDNNKEMEDQYEEILLLMNELISGSMELNVFENMLKTRFGSVVTNKALVMDKLLQNIIRQLQLISSDEASKDIVKLFLESQLDNEASQSEWEAAYARYTRRIMHLLDDEYCFKLIVNRSCKSIVSEMVDTDVYMMETAASCQQWENYLDEYLRSDATKSTNLEQYYESNPRSKLFLKRNMQFERDLNQFTIIENEEVIFAQLSYKPTFNLQSYFYLHRRAKKEKKISLNVGNKRKENCFNRLFHSILTSLES